jgi:VanZ family protein
MLSLRVLLACPSRRSEVAGSRRAYAIVFGLIVAFILYGSLYPFQFHASTMPIGPLTYLLSTRADWDHPGDLLSNILLYIPFGFFGVCASGRRAAPLVILAAAMLATGIELTQFYDRGRVTSMGDVYADTIGGCVGAMVAVVVGIGIRWPWLRALRADPAAGLVLLMWFGYRLYPYVPVSGWHKYIHSFSPFVFGPPLTGLELARFAIAWSGIGAVVNALYGARRGLITLVLLIGAEIVGRILIIDATVKPADLLGAALAFLTWLLLRRLGQARFAMVACAFLGMIAVARLEPFVFTAAQHTFGWEPFGSFMRGSIGVAMQAFCEKFFQYGGLIWLLRQLGFRTEIGTVVTALLLFATSWAETFVPGRSAEITDATMALAIGGVFALLDGRSRRSYHASV